MRLSWKVGVALLFLVPGAQAGTLVLGRVLDPTCSGVPNLVVKLLPPNTSNLPVVVTATGDHGLFQVEVPIAGDYYVSVYQGPQQLYGRVNTLDGNESLTIVLKGRDRNSPDSCEVQNEYKEEASIYRELAQRDPDTYLRYAAASLNNLAELYRTTGRFAEAEPLYRRALMTDEEALGPSHPNVARDLNNLALVYKSQGKFAEAEPLYRRALMIDEKTLGPDHPDLARDFNNLALLYKSQGKFAEAEAPVQTSTCD